jgi:uncharacterized cysteine cluster protein YcgN (CxxCxxCC family)
VIFLPQYSSSVLTKKCPFIKELTCKPVIQPGTCHAYRLKNNSDYLFWHRFGFRGRKTGQCLLQGEKVKGIDADAVPRVIFLTCFFFSPAGRHAPKFPVTRKIHETKSAKMEKLCAGCWAIACQQTENYN